MIYSMTGYGKAVNICNDKKICVEIRSLNGKAMDLTARMSPQFREKEMEIRTLVSTMLERGKVDFALWIEQNEQVATTPINVGVLQSYVRQIKEVSVSTGLPMPENWFDILLRMPDVLTRSEVVAMDENEWEPVKQTIIEAVESLLEFRCQEGAALAQKFNEKISNISNLLLEIEPYENGRIEKIRSRIIDTLESHIGTEYDTSRFEQELIYYIEKFDVNEEKQRLSNHLAYFVDTIEGERGQGKKLGFITQEMGREINTLGSKSNMAEMQKIVVKMKDELEQIKEQVLNVM